MSTEIERIDKGLGKIYTQHDSQKDYYPNGTNKPGLFAIWCDEQGFDDNDVKDEMQHPADACTLVDYCTVDEFPFSYDIIGQDSDDTKALKQNEMYKIIKLLCASTNMKGKQPRDPTHKYKHPNQINLYFEQTDFKQSVDIYTKHVYHTLGYHGIHEQSLMNLLTVSRVNNNFPFLRYMVDSFQRDRVKYNFKGINSALSLNDWFLHNNYCQNLSKRDPNKAEELKQAIVSYCNRISPNFQFAPQVKINDSIKIISQYVCAATKFISKLIGDEETDSVLPFQCDMIIRFNSVVDNVGTIEPIDEDDTTKDEDQNSDKIDCNFDYVGNVKNKIAQEKLVHFPSTIPHMLKAQKSDTTGDDIISRYIMRTYRNFSRKVREANAYKPKNNESKTDDDSTDTKRSDYTWPNRRRFCTFIDRFNAPENKEDDLLFYEPPKDAKVYPNPGEYVPEWHFENLRKCIVPRIGYGSGKNEKNNLEEIRNFNAKERSKKATITSAESCNGQIGTFSFHVTQRDEICCYFFWEGQVLRFYPQDILEVFPYIFVDKVKWNKCEEKDENDKKEKEDEKLMYNNKEFVKSLEGKKLGESMIIQDFQFESWYCDLCEVDDFPKY